MVAKRFITAPSPPTNQATLAGGNHKGMKGIVLHRRLYVNSHLPDLDIAENFCFEATFLGSTGDEVDAYRRRIFSMMAITTILTTSQLYVFNLLLPGGEVRDGNLGASPLDAPGIPPNHNIELPDVTEQEFLDMDVTTDGVQEYGTM